MTSGLFNAAYRPMVKQAWMQQCARTKVAPNNRSAYDLWYQQTLHELTKGLHHSTRGMHEREQRHLLAQFELMVGASIHVQISGWSEAQVSRFDALSRAAHRAAQVDGDPPPYIDWIAAVLRSERIDCINDVWAMPDTTESFDRVMAHLAIQANDEYWIRRTAEQAEVRLRFQIRQFLSDLEFLTKTPHDWGYIVGMWRQADQMPQDIDDAPAQLLWKVLQMLDTHIRRLCRDYQIAPQDLPSRSPHHQARHMTIPTSARHIHVGAELEHASPLSIVCCADDLPF